MHVVGLGQCAIDYLFVVDSFPEPDTKKEVIEWTICGGGPVATALVSLSKLGIHCSFHGITGDDESGKKIKDSLKAENVNVHGLLKRPLSSSQTAFIAVEKSRGKRTIFWKRPSGKPLNPDEIPGNFLDNADFLLLDGLMIEASIYAAKKAREKNIPVMLDAGRIRKGMIELAVMCDYVVASEEFARDLAKVKMTGLSGAGLSDLKKILVFIKNLGVKFRTNSYRTCTITLGGKGSITLAGDETFLVPAFKVDATDTTGAGDVFHGGYIYGLLQKWDIRNVVRFATAFASLKCRKFGGRAGIATLKEVEELLTAPDYTDKI